MSTVKIEHVNPNTSHPIAFDVMTAPRKDKDGNAVQSTKNPDGTLTYEDGTVVQVDRDGNEIRETMTIAPGHFRIIELSGGLMLHEVSQAELTERERKVTERQEIEAEVARERKAKADQEHAEKVRAEREEHKKKIEAEAAKQDKDDGETSYEPSPEKESFPGPAFPDSRDTRPIGMQDPVQQPELVS